MAINIIADSCCDLTDELKKMLNIKLVSFAVIVGEDEFTDDENINIPNLLKAIKAYKGPTSSACPSPENFLTHMQQDGDCFVITISSKLSGSYNSAIVAKQLANEKYPDKKIHVFDSKSAAAGETRIALLLHKLIQEGKDFDSIVAEVSTFIDEMQTRFVLEDLSTLIKNGRISKAAGVVGSMLNLRPIMAADSNGQIVALEKVRGTQNAMVHLVDNVANYTKDVAKQSLTLVMTYCNCTERAQKVKSEILLKCDAIKEVIFIPTAGLSSFYANDGGIILAF